MKDHIVEVSFNIILLAGDARGECEKALTSLEKFEYKVARNYLKEAEKKIIEAHKLHTDMLQKDIEHPEDSEYVMLFSHAQDTLMTIDSEIKLAKHILALFIALDKKIEELQK
jgi:PTS system cellobiose-specific IIA component